MEWTESNRKDLSMIPKMESLGFTTEFAYQDEMHKRLTPEKPPQFGVNFKKDNLYVWKIMEGWQTATLDDSSRFVNHKPYKTIEDFIETLK